IGLRLHQHQRRRMGGRIAFAELLAQDTDDIAAHQPGRVADLDDLRLLLFKIVAVGNRQGGPLGIPLGNRHIKVMEAFGVVQNPIEQMAVHQIPRHHHASPVRLNAVALERLSEEVLLSNIRDLAGQVGKEPANMYNSSVGAVLCIEGYTHKPPELVSALRPDKITWARHTSQVLRDVRVREVNRSEACADRGIVEARQPSVRVEMPRKQPYLLAWWKAVEPLDLFDKLVQFHQSTPPPIPSRF